jgi:hypothetical protein
VTCQPVGTCSCRPQEIVERLRENAARRPRLRFPEALVRFLDRQACSDRRRQVRSRADSGSPAQRQQAIMSWRPPTAATRVDWPK